MAHDPQITHPPRAMEAAPELVAPVRCYDGRGQLVALIDDHPAPAAECPGGRSEDFYRDAA